MFHKNETSINRIRLTKYYFKYHTYYSYRVIFFAVCRPTQPSSQELYRIFIICKKSRVRTPDVFFIMLNTILTPSYRVIYFAVRHPTQRTTVVNKCIENFNFSKVEGSNTRDGKFYLFVISV